MAYLPVSTLTGATERRKEQVSYRMECRVNPESSTRALVGVRAGSLTYPLTTLTGATERRKERVWYPAVRLASKKGPSRGKVHTKVFVFGLGLGFSVFGDLVRRCLVLFVCPCNCPCVVSLV